MEVAERAAEAGPYMAMSRSERCSKAKAMYTKNRLYLFYVRMAQMACNLAANGYLITVCALMRMAHELDVDAFWELFGKQPQDFVTVRMLWPLVACLDGKEASLRLLKRFAVGEVTDEHGRLFMHARGAAGEDRPRFAPLM